MRASPLLPAVLLAILAVTPDAAAQSKATIEKLNAQFVAAFNAGDATAVAKLYSDHAVVLPPGAEMVKGRANIEAFWKGAAQQLGDAKLTTLEVLPLGPNAAREIGRFSLKTKGATPQEILGKYVVIWQRSHRTWQLTTDIWNTDK